ncbi:probable xyloglucan endotransglucosylase/hydrolase protein 33 [Actinidia eriantha]|uniref:probable xyloglucan endotransglucosylase/hydrolase protein 33 n=1 Tax=Actinidia eriantha TaxID=165200 RepID=UPI002588AD9C|nr:probable xyloglucan endotransglucosylase/hydrolase protein 33 [Actinidia eriantha]
MACAQERLLLLSLLIFFMISSASSRGAIYKPPIVPSLTDRFNRVAVNQGYSEFFGHSNIRLLNNGSNADLILNKSSGSGLVSRNKYHHGFFNAAIKLPSGFTSGVVIAFYLSNADLFPHNHDEIDIELLGHEKRRDWVLQTNIYGNGSVHTGREEKLYLWFDPTQEFHQYSILWNSHHIVFLVDNVPVREFAYNSAISGVYPSKPMSVYATIWDASEWATHGGKYPVNYQYGPFVVSLGEMEMEGCVWQQPKDSSAAATASCSRSGLSSFDPVEGQEFAKLSQEQINGLEWARKKLMFYSYCKDTSRYKVLPPECKPS